MSFLVATSEPDFGVLTTDTRRPSGAGEFEDDVRKQVRLERGIVGYCGATFRWARLHGTRLDDLHGEIRRLHRSGLKWAASVDGRRTAAERAHQQALDGPAPDVPDGVDPTVFTRFAAVSLDAPGVHLFATHGPPTPDPVPSAVFFPPGREDVDDDLIRRGRERGGSPTPLSWAVAVRASAALVAEASDIWRRVGGTVDVAVADREAGELRRGRAPAAELVEATDEELLKAVQVPGLGDRIRRRLAAARWTARTKAETV